MHFLLILGVFVDICDSGNQINIILIAINRIQNKSFVYNICMCAVIFIMYI